MTGGFAKTCERIAESRRFQLFIFVVILANAVVIGLQTYPSVDSSSGDFLNLCNDVFLGIFVVEIAIRMSAFGSRPQDYFKDGWNVFDFVIIAASFLPGVRENATLLRVIRLLRVVRIVSIFPDLRLLLRGMVRSLSPIGTMALLTLMLIYIYGMFGWILFEDTEPARWGDIGDAMLTLFVVLTLEAWPEIMYSVTDVHPWAWVYFVSFVLIASFLLLNMVIAILINSLEEIRAMDRIEERLQRRQEAREDPGGTADTSERLAKLREAIDELEEELVLDGRAAVPTRSREDPRVMKRFRG